MSARTISRTNRSENSHRFHYWLVAQADGKPYLVYGGPTEDIARAKGLEMLSGIDFEVKRLATKNLSRASSLLKGRRLEQTHSLHEAGKRLGHNKSLRRLKQKKTPIPDWT